MAANYSRLDTFRRQLLAGTAAYGLIAAGGMGLAHAAGALPQGGQVIGGSASISYASPTQLNITSTTGNSAIAWQSFSIGQGNSVNVAQPSANSTQLEQVNGPSASQIFGSLSSNGRIVVANPNGIWFGPSAQVDVAGLVATTAHASPADVAAFAAGGNLNLSQAGTATASVVNQGTITISQAGLAAFVAPGVANQGVIQAKLGTVQLASGTTATVDFYGDGLINLAVTGQTTAQAIGPDGKALAAAVNNTGTLNADGGTVLMTANTAAGVVDQVINTTGIVQARAVAQQGGQIVLDGGDTGTVMVAGTLDASGRAAGQTGGTVNVLGNNVQLASNAVVDVSGDAGGGTALIGGNFHGAGTQRHAATTTVAQGAKILADAVSSGNGGQVAVWSDQSTSFDGTISAKGGAQGGNGGQVETSGESLTVGDDAIVDASAANGSAGDWLLDPVNGYVNSTGTPPASDPTAGAISNTAVQNGLATNDVTISTGASFSVTGATVTTPSSGTTDAGDLFVMAPILWSSGHNLTLAAGHSLFIESPITHSGASAAVLNLSYNGGVTPNLLTATNAQLGTDGRLFIFGSNVAGSLTGAVTLVAGLDSLNINSTPYTLITNLNSINPATVGAHYALDADINCTTTPGSCTNFATATLEGTLEGLGHTVSNLTFTAAATGATGVGLFSAIDTSGVVNDFGLLNSTITISAKTSVNIGSIAGTNSGVITNSFVKNGTVLGPTSQPVSNQAEEGIGGLVGANEGLIMSSFTDGTNVTANGKGSGNGSFIYDVAGFVGFNDTTGRVVSSFATNTTINQTNSSGEGTFVAGFIGDNKGSVMADIYFGPLTLTMNGHPTQGTFAAAGNCSGATPLSCTAGNLNITLTTDSKPYDGTTSSSALPTASGLAANGDSFYTGLLQEAFSSPNVGTSIPMTLADSFLLINYGGTTGPNYFYTANNPAPVTGTITARPLTITASNVSTAYGTTPVALTGFTVAPNGLVNGETISSVTETSTDNVAAKNAGTYTGNILITAGSEVGGNGFLASNYSITLNPGNLTITPSASPVVITAANQSTAYGTTPITLNGLPPEFTVTGLVANNQIASVTLTSTDNVVGTNAGTYTGNIIASAPVAGGGTGFLASNYASVSFVAGNLTITPSASPVVITAANQSTAYGTTPITLNGLPPEFTVTGLVANNQIASVTLTSTDNVAAKNAGTYTGNIIASAPVAGGGTGFLASNYASVSFVAGNLTITPSASPVVITAANQSTAYGTTPITLNGLPPEFTVTGLVANNQIASVTLTSSANVANENAGTYTGNIIASAPVAGGGTGFLASNYASVSFVAGNLTITPSASPVVITAANQSTAYGTTPITLNGLPPEFTVTGLVANNQIASVTLTSTDNVAAKNAGTYTGNIIASAPVAGGGTGFLASNYASVSFVAGNLTITPSLSPVVVTAANESTAYGTTVNLTGLPPQFSVTGLVANNQIASVTLTSTDNVVGTNAGTYTGNIIASAPVAGGGTGFLASNYASVSFVAGNLTITPSLSPVVVTAANESTAYGTTVNLTGLPPQFSVTGLVANNQIASVTLTSTDNVVGTNAGTYTGNIIASAPVAGGGTGFLASNYASVSFVAGNLTITPSLSPVVVTAANESTAYGTTPITLNGLPPEFTVTGLVANNQIASVTLTSTDNVVGTNAGTYTGNIIASAPVAGGGTGFLASNYASVSFVAGNLTITPSASPVVITAANQSTAYGTTPITLNGLPPEFTVTGLVANNQIASVTLTSTDNVAAKNAGTYTGNIIASAPVAGGGTGFLASNYASVSFVAGNLTITPSASPVVITAANQSTAYGTTPITLNGLPPEFTVTGLVANNQIASVTLTSTDNVVGTNAGTYTGNIIASAPVAGGGTGFLASNYASVSFVAGNLTITPSASPVVITAANQSTAYGTTPITLNGLPPEFTVTGLVANNQIASVTLTSTDNVVGTNAGTYTGNIIASAPVAGGGTGFLASNYASVSFVAGNLTITPSASPVVITAANQSTAYGTTPITLNGLPPEFTVTGLVANNQIASVTLTSTDNVAAKNAGTYTGNIIASAPVAGGGTGFLASNYASVSFVAGNLTITPSLSPVVVTAANESTAYGTTVNLTGLPPQFSVTGLVANNQIASVTLTSTDNVVGTNAGTYTGNIIASAPVAGGGTGFLASNYASVSFVAGNLTITPSLSPVVVTAANESTAYGTTVNLTGLPPQFSVTGLVANNQIASVTLTSTDNVVGTNAGTYTGNIIASAPVAGGGTGFLASNYASVSFVAGNLTITPSLSPVVVTAANESTAYGTTPITLNGLPPEFTVTGLVANNQIASVTLTSTDNVVGTNAGTYTGNIIASAPVAGGGTGFLASNYASVSFVAGNLTITPSASPVVITAANQSTAYGTTPITLNGLPPEFTVTGLVANNQIASVTLTSTDNVAAKNAGTYTGNIIASAPVAGGGTGFLASNYASVSFVAGNLTITPSASPVVITAANQSTAYGTTPITLNGLPPEFTVTGLVANNQIASVTLTSTDNVVGTNAGTYTGNIIASAPVAGGGTGFLASNYASVSFVAGNLTITPSASPVVITAANQSTAYGTTPITLNGLPPEFTVTGLVANNQIASVTLTSTDNVAAKNAGTYTGNIIASAPVAGGGTGFLASNYASVSFVAGNLTITPSASPVVITAANQSTAYGTTPITLNGLPPEFTVTGLVANNQIASVTLTSTDNVAAKNAGTYTGNIIASAPVAGGGTGFLASNYASVSFVAGNLTITPSASPVVITAADQSQNFGSPFVFTGLPPQFSVTGLVAGNTISSVNLTSSGDTATAAAGTYPIIPSGGTGNFTPANYLHVTYVDGTLTVVGGVPICAATFPQCTVPLNVINLTALSNPGQSLLGNVNPAAGNNVEDVNPAAGGGAAGGICEQLPNDEQKDRCFDKLAIAGATQQNVQDGNKFLGGQP